MSCRNRSVSKTKTFAFVLLSTRFTLTLQSNKECMAAKNHFDVPEEREVSFPPAHTAEHLLNQTMVRMFGCERAVVAHIERKKSKMTFVLERKPDRKQEKEIEQRMNCIGYHPPGAHRRLRRMPLHRKTRALDGTDREI